MYDWEVINYLKDKNYKLTSDEYIYLCSTCPQITHIKYNSFEDNFEIKTDCNSFKFKVYCKTNND